MFRTPAPFLVLLALMALPGHAAAVTVTSLGPMQQVNDDGLPGTHVREFCTIWDAGDASRLTGIVFFTQSATSPLGTQRATTADGGLTWTAGEDVDLDNPSPASTDTRNPVVRDFDRTGDLTGFFGSRQGVAGGFSFDELLFRAASADTGAAWSGETLISFGPGAFASHSGMNGFIEVFRLPDGTLRGYTAMNNMVGAPPPPSATRLVESTDGGFTFSDLGSIHVPGPGGAFNVVGANGPVFTFTDESDGLAKMGWFVFGEGGGNRGVHLLTSTDQGLDWDDPGVFSVLDETIRSGDAHFLSDGLLRLFYYRNVAGSPSDRQVWVEDFEVTGMLDVVANNVFGPDAPPFDSLDECLQTLIEELCGGLKGKARRDCVLDVLELCLDQFGIPGAGKGKGKGKGN